MCYSSTDHRLETEARRLREEEERRRRQEAAEAQRTGKKEKPGTEKVRELVGAK